MPTDDPKQVATAAALRTNKSRLRFYERYGARPILNTLYDQPIRPGNPSEPRLLYDPLQCKEPLEGAALREVIRLILTHRYNYDDDDPYVAQVVASVTDGPVAIRPPAVPVQGDARPAVPRRLHPLKVFCSARHSLHHIRERGYVERPARVDVILKAISDLPDDRGAASPSATSAKARSRMPSTTSTSSNYRLKNICSELPKGELLYPYVFPIRRTDRPPYDRTVRAGYYCIDTFTPLSLDAYQAARAAVNVALSGASAILDGEPLVYSLCRPPGHHAERDTYGGFCYFCNGAIAAQYLATKLGGKVAVLDVDYHHGNGTQDIFYTRSDILTVSIHGHPNFAYPYFSGFADEKGEARGLAWLQPQPPARRGRPRRPLPGGPRRGPGDRPPVQAGGFGRLARPGHRQGRPDRHLEHHPRRARRDRPADRRPQVPDAARPGGRLQHPLPRPQRRAAADGLLRGGAGAEGVELIPPLMGIQASVLIDILEDQPGFPTV